MIKKMIDSQGKEVYLNLDTIVKATPDGENIKVLQIENNLSVIQKVSFEAAINLQKEIP